MIPAIQIRGARLHNLKNISLDLPRNRLIAFTGVSGSGKSTLAFDLLHREGQRQYMESLGMVTYESRAPVEAINGLCPTISVEQVASNRSPRSTLGTASEVYTYLRVLYARLAHRPCPACGADVPPSQLLDDPRLISWEDDQRQGDPEISVSCPACGSRLPELSMASFSFNKPEGACPRCTGLGTVYSANLARVLDEQRSLAGGALSAWEPRMAEFYLKTLASAASYYGFEFDLQRPVGELGPALRDLLLYGAESDEFRQHYPHRQPPTTVAQGRFEGLVPILLRRRLQHAGDEDSTYLEKLEQLLQEQACPACQGTRLRDEARSASVQGMSIVDVSKLPLEQLFGWVQQLAGGLSALDQEVAAPVITDLQERLRRLLQVGLGYLTLERNSPSLSTGEQRRMRLAALLGSGLTGVLYVLDEPTIGLHARDSLRLAEVLRQLRDLGNTVLLIEHDLDLIRACDWLVDLGPGGGRAGGQVVAQGSPAEVASMPTSLTGQYLSGSRRIALPATRRPPGGPTLSILGGREHNLKDIDVSFPVGRLSAVTGVSGSGKSTLVFEILARAGRRHFYAAAHAPGAHRHILGWEHFGGLATVDQQPLGRSRRSNAATYSEAFGAMRKAFAAQPAAVKIGLEARHFSFNLAGGRCERCQGAGELAVEMHFLPDVLVRCPVCHGRRFQAPVLEVKFGGLDIAQVLDLTISEALVVFQEVPEARERLELLNQTGLGYLQLGQSASSFSGGEAQRVKLARELSGRSSGRTLYLLDEPTSGLHPADVERLVQLLQRLVEAGNTVVVVEHNLELVKCADWVIDLGPGGGEDGGSVVAQGTPEKVAECEESVTGRMLRRLGLGDKWKRDG